MITAWNKLSGTEKRKRFNAAIKNARKDFFGLTRQQRAYAEIMARRFSFNLLFVERWIRETNPDILTAPENNRSKFFEWAF